MNRNNKFYNWVQHVSYIICLSYFPIWNNKSFHVSISPSTKCFDHYHLNQRDKTSHTTYIHVMQNLAWLLHLFLNYSVVSKWICRSNTWVKHSFYTEIGLSLYIWTFNLFWPLKDTLNSLSGVDPWRSWFELHNIWLRQSGAAGLSPAVAKVTMFLIWLQNNARQMSRWSGREDFIVLAPPR